MFFLNFSKNKYIKQQHKKKIKKILRLFSLKIPASNLERQDDLPSCCHLLS